ncbi:MAG: HD domain-containing protein [Candidatus Jordarchaeaceae archaeon]
MELLKTNNVPRNIINHSLIVSKVAVFLARELNKRGFNLNIDEIEAAALLHDIKKIESMEKGTGHAHEAWLFLKQLGYSEVAEIVKQHVFLDPDDGSSKIREEEIVNYSDKRVRHTTIVSLKERFEYLKERYGKDEESIKLINNLEKKAFEIENKLFSNLDFKPEEIPKLIRTSY